MCAAERASEASRAEQAQRVSRASERANGRVSDPVLQSVFLVILAYSARYLNGGCVDVELLEDGEGLFVEFGADGEIGDVGRVVVVQSVDVFHHARPVRFDRRQNQQILQVSEARKGGSENQP